MRALLFAPLVLSAFLTACAGFQPLHRAAGDGGSLAPLSQVSVAVGYPDDADDKRAAYLIRQALESRIGEDDAASRYLLRLTPRVRRSGLAVGRDDVASRFDYTIATRYQLVERATGATVSGGTLYNTASFGAPRDPYGRISAELNAAEQASGAAADALVTELALHFADIEAEGTERSAE